MRCRDPGGTRTGNRGTGAVLTGATGWIGLIVARSLGRDGLQTLLCAWDADAYAVSQLLREKGMDADGQTCEVRSTGQVDTVVHAAVDRYGPIDAPVGNAGRNGGGPAAGPTDELWLDAVDTRPASPEAPARPVRRPADAVPVTPARRPVRSRPGRRAVP
ncbi:SDR family NAD(P)-dependent oxidoreductase [Streptomyces celluloflavus]|uniref:SDR family NAD(P)-dependent oxidoreductase n=1 Tax=Streptomyces celluloflavus TaxID=58344 RepID=UPI0034607F40|nr:SDR family NAD(P)-dependent oxidoreductase [Streptomyces celluloflavus]